MSNSRIIFFGPEGYTPLPSGNYVAKVKRVNPECDGKYGRCVQVEFEIVSGKYAGKPIGKRMRRGRIRDQFWHLIKILTGNEFDEINGLDLDSLVEQRCLLQIEYGYDKDQKRNRSRIVDFLPLEQRDDKNKEEDSHESGRLGS